MPFAEVKIFWREKKRILKKKEKKKKKCPKVNENFVIANGIFFFKLQILTDPSGSRGNNI